MKTLKDYTIKELKDECCKRDRKEFSDIDKERMDKCRARVYGNTNLTKKDVDACSDSVIELICSLLGNWRDYDSKENVFPL